MANLEEFGYIVRDAREARKMSQADLGLLIGLSRASVSLLERGEIKYPRIALIEKLAEILEIPKQPMLEAAGLNLPDVEGGELQWLMEELDRPNRRRLVALAYALLREQQGQLQKGRPRLARP